MTKQKKTQGLVEDRILLEEGAVRSTIKKMVDEILERNPSPQKLFLVGIRTGGVFLAARMQEMIKSSTGHEVPMGVMDITLYRDDVFDGLPLPEVGPTELPCLLEGHTVILVDDVLYTGRTVRAALAELIDFGRPDCVRLAVLVDRGHRELPIHADYVGLKIDTQRDQSVLVFWKELSGPDRVVLFRRVR